MVPPSSIRVSRVPIYSGYCYVACNFVYGAITLFGWLSLNHSTITYQSIYAVLNPVDISTVWPLTISLATTLVITFVFSSCCYLDVSLRSVPFTMLCIHIVTTELYSARLPHSDIYGYIGYLRLTVAFRSLSRPSSAPGAKASTLCSYYLVLYDFVYFF